MATVLEMVDLTKVYKTSLKGGTLAVDKVTLAVEEGEIYGLVGPNGSGKTTTLKLLLGLLYPTGGEVFLFGKDPVRNPQIRERVGFLPEGPYFYDFLNGRELLSFYGSLLGLDGKAREKRVEELLEQVGMKEWEKEPLARYSRGMVQRLGLAQALINNPDLVLLDEPTAGLDPLGAKEIRELILNLKGQGKTVFLCSHLLDEVQRICDRVGILHRGKLLQEMEVASLAGRLEDVFVNLVEEGEQ